MDPVSKAQAGQTSQSKRTLRGGHDPSIGRQWPKGTSGNPGGRSKKAEITKIFEEILHDKTHRDEIKDAVAVTLKSGRMAGVLLLREAAERLEGKVTQGVEVNGELSVTLADTIARRRQKVNGGDK